MGNAYYSIAGDVPLVLAESANLRAEDRMDDAELQKLEQLTKAIDSNGPGYIELTVSEWEFYVAARVAMPDILAHIRELKRQVAGRKFGWEVD